MIRAVEDRRIVGGEHPGAFELQHQPGQGVGEHVVHFPGQSLPLGQPGRPACAARVLSSSISSRSAWSSACPRRLPARSCRGSR